MAKHKEEFALEFARKFNKRLAQWKVERKTPDLLDGQLAKVMGIDQSLLSRYLLGKQIPSAETIHIIATRLGIEESELLDMAGREAQEEGITADLLSGMMEKDRPELAGTLHDTLRNPIWLGTRTGKQILRYLRNPALDMETLKELIVPILEKYAAETGGTR